MKRPDTYRFAVLGDVHYCLDREGLYPAGCAETDDKPRYVWMRTHLFPKLLAELQEHAPEMVICTGDIVEGGAGEPSVIRRELEEVFARFSEAKLPILNAKGTHETGIYSEVALPLFSSLLGEKITENYFVVDRGGARLVVLDYLKLAPGTKQAQWLRDCLQSTPEGMPLFIFAHAPFVLSARPFFSYEPMQQVLNDVFSRRPPTVFFCGHTHNQAFTYHRRGYGAFVQIKGSSEGFPAAPIEPLEIRHVLLLGEEDTYYWGTLEDQCPAYWILDVSGGSILASWYGVGYGLLGQAQLSIAGEEPVILKRPAFRVNYLCANDLPLVQQASLEACMYDGGKGDFEFCLNGERLGFMAPNNYFAPRRFLPLTKGAIVSLKARNEITVVRGSAPSWLLGGVRIVAWTYDGRRLVSRVPPHLLGCGDYAKRTAGDPNFKMVGPEESVCIDLNIDEG